MREEMASSDQSTSVVDVEVEKVVEEKKMEEGEESGEKISELEKRKSVEKRNRHSQKQTQINTQQCTKK